LLTSVQLAKLLITSRILTDTTRASAETDVTEIMKTLQTRSVSELHTFLREVNSLVAQVKGFLQLQTLFSMGTTLPLVGSHFHLLSLLTAEPSIDFSKANFCKTI